MESRQPPLLRRGEILAAAGALAQLVVLFAFDWLGSGRSGWDSIPVLRWFVVVASLTALTLMATQATMRGPALPASLSVISTVLSGLTTLLLVIRLLTAGATPQVGAYLGVAAAIVMTYGSYRSLRVEQGWTPGPDRPVETVPLRTHKR